MRLCICDWCGGSGLTEAESVPGWAAYEDDGEAD